MVAHWRSRDLDIALEQSGRSALATEAVPAASLGAATAPELFTGAIGHGAPWSLRVIGGLYLACRAMMGACIGARQGEAT